MYHRTKGKNTGQILFFRDMLLLINHVVYWSYICQRKQGQINKNVSYENATTIDHNYRMGDNVLTRTKSVCKIKKPFKVFMKLFKPGKMVPPPYE